MDTTFKNSIVDALTKKGLTESSVKLYLRNLEKLNDNQPLKNLKFLSNPDTILSKLVDYKPNTKKGYLIAITATLNSIKGDNKVLNKLYQTYSRLMIDTANEIRNKPTEEKSETQTENWISWEDVKSKFNDLKDQVKTFENSKKINEGQYNTLLSYTILSLYCLIPPRRNEYQKTYIVKKNSGDLPIDKNYYAVDDSMFIFNVYKTAKKNGQQTLKVPTELENILKTYIKFHPLLKGKKITAKVEVPFLVHFDGSPLDKVNSITRILNKVFDKKIGSSMLRHIFLSDKYGDVVEEQKEDAEKMAHTISTQKDYIKK